MPDGSDPDAFTERRYRGLVAAASERYRFEPFGTSAEEPHVLWRHDVDCSVHRALAMARIEAEAGVSSTYFLLFHGWFYNLLERPVLDRAREIMELGHWLGLHFDVGFYPGLSEEGVSERLAAERRMLEELMQRPVAAFSFHNPDVGPAPGYDSDEMAGMINAYGRGLGERYTYVSDSNGYWRFQSLPELVAAGTERRLHVLTHPEWWQKEPMPPRARLQRCLDGRARSVGDAYDKALERAGRDNVR